VYSVGRGAAGGGLGGDFADGGGGQVVAEGEEVVGVPLSGFEEGGVSRGVRSGGKGRGIYHVLGFFGEEGDGAAAVAVNEAFDELHL